MSRLVSSSRRDEYGYPTTPDSRRRLRNFAVHSSKSVLLAGITVSMGIIGAYLRLQRWGKPKPSLNPGSFTPQRILVLRMDLIGDLVLSLTVVRALKQTYPTAEIDLVALPSSAKIVMDDPDLAEIIPYDPNIWRRPTALFKKQNWLAAQALSRHLHDRHYDLAVSVFGPWAAILAVLSGAPRRLGFGAESYPGFMTDNVTGKHWHSNDHLHEVDYCMQLAAAAGAHITPESRIPHLFVPAHTEQEVTILLQNTGVDATKPLIACHVSSNNGQSKRWPIPYWAKLIDQLILEEHMQVVFTGAPDDQPLIEAISQRMKTRAYNLAGKTSLTQLAALLKQANLLITGDSGPMHIAAAVGTSLIAIHGPTDPALSGPVSPHATILRSDIWCSPCYQAKGAPADCRFFTTQCMKNITPAMVHTTIHEILSLQAVNKHL